MENVACINLNFFQANLRDDDLEPFLELSPIIAIRQKTPVAILINYKGIKTESAHFKEELKIKIRSLLIRSSNLKEIADSFQLGIGKTAGLSLIDSLFQTTLDAPLTAQVADCLLDPFGVLRTASRIDLSVLGQLGIHTLRTFSQIPIESLASRFGKNGLDLALKIQETITVSDQTPWPIYRPIEPIIESLDYPPEHPLLPHLDAILFGLRELLIRVCRRLKTREERALHLIISIKQESFNHFMIHAPLCQPQGAVSGILPYLQEKLSHWVQTLNPKGSSEYGRGILKLAVKVQETAPGHCSQVDFFNLTEENLENWDSLYSRVNQKIKNRSFFKAKLIEKYLPEKSWIPSQAHYSASPDHSASKPRPTRPTLLLKEAVLITIKNNQILIPQQHFHLPVETRILRWIGPERIQEGWWEKSLNADSPTRDYYKIICDSGLQLWIYFDHSKRGYFLHGYFD